MNIAELIGGKKQQNIFVTFILGKNWVQAGVWEVIENKGTLLSAGNASPWQEDPSSSGGSDSFIEAADDSLSSAIGQLLEEPKLTNVVFGLPPQWVDEGNIKNEKLQLLKSLCEKLELKPSGFVVIPEALVFSFKQKEGGGSFILVGIGEEEIELTILAGGNAIYNTSIARSISLGEDITEGLSRSDIKDPLPSRIILYNRHTNELSQARTDLASWEWSQDLFLHTPRIEVLPPDAVISAVSEAAAVEVAHVAQFTTPQEQPTEEIFPESADQELETTEENMEPPRPEQTEIEEPQEQYDDSLTQPQFEPEQTAIKEQPQKESRIPRIPFPPIPLYKVAAFTIEVFKRRPKTPILVLGFISTFIIFSYWFWPKAMVTTYLVPQKIEAEIPLAISPDASGKVLPGRTISSGVSGEKTISTSGRKVVGERAKGEVIIFNNTASPRTFTTDTILTSPRGLKFVLNDSVSVASESGAPDYKPGQTKTQVSAGDIGAEYNLAAGNIFSLANFATSSFSARNDVPLTGGSSKEVASVEKADQEMLEEELKRELTEKTLSQIASQISANEILIPESAVESNIKSTFSAKVGEETETLSLKLELSVDALVTSREELEKYVAASISNKIPPGFSFQSSYLSVSFFSRSEKEEKNKNEQTFQARVTALLLPQVNTKDLAKIISGKTIEEARSTFVKLPGFARSSVKFSPLLPGPLGRLPLRPENIKIEVQPER